MKTLKIITFACAMLFIHLGAFAQGSRGFNPEKRVEREQAHLLESITDLSDDQRKTIESVYGDYTNSLKEIKEAASEQRKASRTKMVDVIEDKDQAIKEALNEEQYKQYVALKERPHKGRHGHHGRHHQHKH